MYNTKRAAPQPLDAETNGPLKRQPCVVAAAVAVSCLTLLAALGGGGGGGGSVGGGSLSSFASWSSTSSSSSSASSSSASSYSTAAVPQSCRKSAPRRGCVVVAFNFAPGLVGLSAEQW